MFFAEVDRNRAQDALAALEASGLSRFQKIQESRIVKDLCKEAYRTTKVQHCKANLSRAVLTFTQKASKRGIDSNRNVVGPPERTNPLGGLSTYPKCQLTEYFQAEASPTTPEEFNMDPPGKDWSSCFVRQLTKYFKLEHHPAPQRNPIQPHHATPSPTRMQQ